MTFIFVCAVNQDGNARRRVRHEGVGLGAFLNESEQTDDYSAPADEYDARMKMMPM